MLAATSSFSSDDFQFGTHLILTDRRLNLSSQTFRVEEVNLLAVNSFPTGSCTQHSVFSICQAESLPRKGHKSVKEQLAAWTNALMLLERHQIPWHRGVIVYGSGGTYSCHTIADFVDCDGGYTKLPQSAYLNVTPANLPWDGTFAAITLTTGFCSFGLHALKGLFGAPPEFCGPLALDPQAPSSDEREQAKCQERLALQREMLTCLPGNEVAYAIPLTSRIVKPPKGVPALSVIAEDRSLFGISEEGEEPADSTYLPDPRDLSLTNYEREEIGRLGLLLASAASSSLVDEILCVYPDIHYRLYFTSLMLQGSLSPDLTEMLFNQMGARRERVRLELQEMVAQVNSVVQVRAESILDVLEQSLRDLVKDVREGKIREESEVVSYLFSLLRENGGLVAQQGCAWLLLEQALKQEYGAARTELIPPRIDPDSVDAMLRELGKPEEAIVGALSLEDISNLGFLLDSVSGLSAASEQNRLRISLYDQTTEGRLVALKKSLSPRLFPEVHELLVLTAPRYGFDLGPRGTVQTFGLPSLYGAEAALISNDFWTLLGPLQSFKPASAEERARYYSSLECVRVQLLYSYSPGFLDDLGGELLWLAESLSRFKIDSSYGPLTDRSTRETLISRAKRQWLENNKPSAALAGSVLNEPSLETRPNYVELFESLSSIIERTPHQRSLLRGALEYVETCLSLFYRDLFGTPPTAEDLLLYLDNDNEEYPSPSTLQPIYSKRGPHRLELPLNIAHDVDSMIREISALLQRLPGT